MKTMTDWKGSLTDYLKPWDEIDEELYYYNWEVLPPIILQGLGAFQVSEPINHNKYGHGVYSTFIEYKNKYYYLGIL